MNLHSRRSDIRAADIRATRSRSGPILAGVLGVAGAAHFLAPAFFDAIVPRALPRSARTWTYLSGAAELAVAATVATPRTRRVGGALAAALFVAVLPGNIQMAIDWRNDSLVRRVLAFGRLPLQVPLVLWGLRVSKDR